MCLCVCVACVCCVSCVRVLCVVCVVCRVMGDVGCGMSVVGARSFPQESWSSTASSGEVNDWRKRKHVVLSLF